MRKPQNGIAMRLIKEIHQLNATLATSTIRVTECLKIMARLSNGIAKLLSKETLMPNTILESTIGSA